MFMIKWCSLYGARNAWDVCIVCGCQVLEDGMLIYQI